MTKNALTFGINSEQHIEILLPRKKEDIITYDDIQVYFKNDKDTYQLFDEQTIHGLEPLRILLTEAINGQCKLHPSIKHDIGFLWNEHLHDTPGYDFAEEDLEGRGIWVGIHHLLWEAPNNVNLATWLYNKNDSIILEITPEYKWHSLEPKEGDNYIPYEEFIKNYKPVLTVEIPLDVAKQWLEQTEELLKILYENIEKYQAEHQNDN